MYSTIDIKLFKFCSSLVSQDYDKDEDAVLKQVLAQSLRDS